MADMRQNGLCKLTLAPLSDHEEMVSALVHPLVQVYPIPRTGQLAYVGHVCTPRQKVTKCLKSLPVMPADMPVVHVRPRQFKGKPAGRALFKAEVRKRKAAFLWLKSNNLYYANVEWRDDAADAWTGDNVEVGRTREADSDSFHVPAVTRLCFARWMEHARSETLAGDFGYTIRKRIREVIMDSGCDDEEPGSASAIESNVWAAIRRFVAEVFRQNVFRMATTHSQNILAVVLAARGVVDLGLPQDMDPANILRAVRSLDTIDCPMDLHVFRAELEAVMMEEYDENPAGVRWSNRPSRLCWCAPELDQQGDDKPDPDAVLDVAQDVVGKRTCVPSPASACPDEDRPIHRRRMEDQPGHGPMHGPAGGGGPARASHTGGHPRIHSESLSKIDSLRDRRLPLRQAWLASDVSLRGVGSVRDVVARRPIPSPHPISVPDCWFRLSSEPSSACARRARTTRSGLSRTGPSGASWCRSIGEKRKMRQKLEAMVHQIESETADLGMNGGAGWTPSGLCTVTCIVYKRAQLHLTLLKAYPSCDAADPACREHYTQWESLSPGSAREAVMKNTYYQLAASIAVAWYCAVKLEMATALLVALLTEQLQSDAVPGRGDAKQKIKVDLCSRMGVDISRVPGRRCVRHL